MSLIYVTSRSQRCQMAVFSARFASHLAGKKYFWRTPNFWRISGGFDQFCMGLFCLADLAVSGGFGAFISKK
jgi:hypothetical protein